MAVPEKGVMVVLEKGMAVLEVGFLMLGTGPASKVEGVKGAMAMRIGTRGKMPSLEGPFARTVFFTRSTAGRDKGGLDDHRGKQGLLLLPSDPVPGC